jgi:hypothetical protein
MSRSIIASSSHIVKTSDLSFTMLSICMATAIDKAVAGAINE